MSNVLIHYGIMGQKWGKRNGPPYPLNESDKSYSERKAGNNIKARDVKKNMDYMNDKELQQAINRINMQNQVDALDKTIIQKGLDKVDGDLKTIGAILATGTTLIAVANKVSKLFN